MKKAMLLALCLLLAILPTVNGAFAFPELSEIFADLTKLLDGLGLPTTGDALDVSLVYLDDAKTPQLSPGGTVIRKVAAANGADSLPAYFRLAFAVQAEALQHMNLHLTGSGYTGLEDWRDITIGSRAYKLMIATYQQELASGGTSEPVILTASLNRSVTSEQMNSIADDFLQIQVLAVEADVFENANENITVGQGQTMAEAVLDRALPIDSPDFNPFE